MSTGRPTALLLNAGHALDHLFLLIFATAVGAIATDWGMIWQDLMPYTAGAFVMFGLGSLPAGRLGDLWGRRAMMVVFFLGMGVSGLLIALTSGVWSLAAALTLMGVFSSIYHPVGIPMLVQGSKNPGFTIGVNGLFGNLGIAVAAMLTGFLVKHIGWRAAFAVPGGLALLCAVLFLLLVPREETAPAKRPRKSVDLPRAVMARVLGVMTLAAVSSSLIFNFTTNGNGQLLAERLRGLIDDPATLGVLLAVVYTIASLAQLVVGKLIDRYPLKWVYLPIVAAQAPLFLLAAPAGGWPLYAAVLAFMIFVFGAIPFVDAMIVQYVDDRMRSRVAGMRLTVSFGVASLAVYLLGPTVKAAGFPPRVRARELWRVPEPWLAEAQDDATRLAIRTQEQAGLDVITDGEVRRESYSNRFATALDGVDIEHPGTALDRSGHPNPVPRIVGPVRRKHPVQVEDVRFLRAHTDRPIKMTVPGPFTMSQQAQNDYYASEAAAALDYALAVNAEIRDLFAAGADVVQVDEPYMQARPEKARQFGLAALNRALEGVTGTTAVHICFGYAAIIHQRPSGYSFLPELAGCPVRQVSIETAQANLDCSVLATLEGKQIMVGCLDLSDMAVETPETVVARVERALAYVTPQNVILAPDCGMKYLPRGVAFAKLAAMVAAAALLRAEHGGG